MKETERVTRIADMLTYNQELTQAFQSQGIHIMPIELLLARVVIVMDELQEQLTANHTELIAAFDRSYEVL